MSFIVKDPLFQIAVFLDLFNFSKFNFIILIILQEIPFYLDISND